MDTPKYKRVLIKISGEAPAGDNKFGLNFDVIGPVCDVVKKCVEIGTEVGIVVGGGNFWRGVKDGGGKMERTRADHMGMLATTINCAGTAGRSGAARCRRARTDRNRDASDRRAVHPQQGNPSSGKGPCRHLRLRHRQPVLLDRYRSGSACGGDRCGGYSAGEEHRRRIRFRSGKESGRKEV